MNKKIFLSLGLAFIMAMTGLFVILDSADAQECRIVRIIGDKGSTGQRLRIEPEITQITKGTCVIWINWVPTIDVRINFKDDGKRCMDATDDSVHFKSAENCYLTDFIKLGGTSSLRFVDAGTFEYHIEVPDSHKQAAAGALAVAFGVVEASGKIVVTE